MNRVLEFIRQYRVSAESLSDLISFFEHYGQPHLANELKKEVSFNDKQVLSKSSYHFLKNSNLPYSISSSVVREKQMTKLRDILIIQSEKGLLLFHFN